jgi:NADH-quinone oxidoreductase subunit K
MSVELMLNAANLALVAFSRWFAGGGAPGGALYTFKPTAAAALRAADGGQVLVLMSMAIAACEVAVGLALLIALFRVRSTVSTAEVADLRG